MAVADQSMSFVLLSILVVIRPTLSQGMLHHQIELLSVKSTHGLVTIGQGNYL